MDRITISEKELRELADKIRLSLDEETIEETRVTLETWMNQAMDVSEEIRKEKYDAVFPAALTTFNF